MSPILLVLVVLQIVTLIVVAILFLRKPSDAVQPDPRLGQIPDTLIRHEARLEAMGHSLDSLTAALRADLAMHRNEAGQQAIATREAHEKTSLHLRQELTAAVDRLSTTLAAGLDNFRADNRTAGEALRIAVTNDLTAIGQRLANFMNETNRAQMEARDSLHARLEGLNAANVQHQEKLRATVEARLEALNSANTAKLEEMRRTVDEKLHETLQTRLTESFGQVTDQLNKVHTGLGEMSKLSEGVDGLSRIFTNVKSRGGFAEVQLGMLLKQMLAPGQFIENAVVKQGSAERVEYAVRFPTNAGERLLPIDAKFPREAWERLEAAYESNVPEAVVREGRAFENAIRTEADRICSKYIHAPATTPYAIMFLPTEGLYAEVIRREALQAEIQSQCHVTIAGPTTLSAILTSFQMGFHMLALQEKGDEVWKVLESTKTEFKNFENLMGNMERQVGTVQNTIQKLNVRTRAINRTLREVSDTETNATLELEDLGSPILRLAAEDAE
ncbi:DNA recombination protein RmuC [Granulicella pectinivorans]|uniref:DNA recombination protein RmuC n=1 Tax=Granulicella pectinivorans TaxID=474950 RepID=A0A1I6L2U1_9BACT|nr:DNA recombination protein RmuC [Granulicella pectinivorans]SFR97784.1 DNA recombination protein RmuC [Granulicella pectinivorans]